MTPSAIRALRLSAGLTQRGLAIKLCLSPWSGPTSVSRWENGETVPRPPTLKLIEIVCSQAITLKEDGK